MDHNKLAKPLKPLNAVKTNNATSSSTSQEVVVTNKKSASPVLKIVGGILLILVVLVGTAGFYFYNLAKTLETPSREAANTASAVVAALQSQDLITAKTSIATLKEQVNSLQAKTKQASFLKSIPFASAYFNDSQSVMTAALAGVDAASEMIIAIEPYSDLLGFKTDANTQVEVKSIEDRIVFIVKTLDKILPQLDSVSTKVSVAREQINSIDPNRYPETFAGKSVRSKIIQLQAAVDSAYSVMTQAKPLISILPELLGDSAPKTYMLLFQNDGELRPTGGFMTAYAFLRVSKGKIEPLGSYNIYDIDSRFTKNVTPPDPIKKYLNESRWYLRNMNFSPDFKVSMDTFTKYYYDVPGVTKIDGIIALDTEVPVRILKLLGPIGVGGWGNFSAEIDKRCDCPQVVYVLEDMITKPVAGVRPDRKAVLGPLMHSMLANMMGSPKSKWPQFLQLGLEAINQKHLLFYFFDEKMQTASESFNAAGRIRPYEFDYLHLSDANFGGAKSDVFIKREIEQEITQDGDKYLKKVSITYTNPQKGSNCNLEAGQLCLNGVYRDYVRLYVPKGSVLKRVVGSEVKEQTFEDLDKTVFEAFFTMRPESSSKLVFEYELPVLNLSPYRMMIQKQAGVNQIKHSISLDGKPFTYEITKDQEIVLE